ncbi:MFS transporter [uncultured Desulfosarcina sp.]|uniref:MFS transporter n=1 Tax=uncultured Desulfosarcina sp. TaxID=218289 RepID=UPI0029C83BFD|nr:MFS transporter [uncultured Desulfosarcina sp.]
MISEEVVVHRSTPYRWMVLSVGAFVQAIVAGAAWTIMPVLFYEISQPRSVGLGLSLVELGAIWGMMPLANAICCIPMGIGADRYGVRWVVGMGILLVAAAGAFRGTADSFNQLLIWMFVFGIGYSSIGPNLPKLVRMWFPSKELGLANGVVMGSYGLGAGLAITFGGSLISPALGGWRNTLYVLGGLSLTIAVVWLIVVRDRKPDKPAAETENAVPSTMFHSISVAIKSRDVWLLAAVMFISQGGYIGAIGYLPLYLAGKGMTQATANGYVSILLYVFVAGSLIVPMISDRLGNRKWIFLISFSINAIAVMATAFLTGPLLAAAFAIWGLSTGAVIICFVVPLEHPSLGPSLAGAINGILLASVFTGGFISPIVGNLIAEKMGGATAIVCWGTCFLVAALIFVMVSETHSARVSKD